MAQAREVIEQQSVDSRKKKELRVLTLTAHAVRVLRGVRIVSCKSAKDRTSMSVTAEQVAVLERWHHLDPGSAPALLDNFRRSGVRMYNTLQNVGKSGYAFNAFQRLLLPRMLRAAANTTVKAQS